MKRLSAPECAMWKSLPHEYLRDVGGELIFNCNFSLKTLPLLSGLPLFYRQVLNAWQRIVAHTPLSKNEVEMRFFGTINLFQLQESQYSIDRGMKPELNT